jgi:hypothetical protein
MSPIKFENHIKEKLEARRIEPSKSSWGTLSTKLNEKKNLPFQKLLIAACLIGVLVTILLTFNKETQSAEITKSTKESISKENILNDKKIISTTINTDNEAVTTKSEIKIHKENTTSEHQKIKKENQTNFNNDKLAEVVTTVIQKVDSLPDNERKHTKPDSVLLKNEVEQLLNNAKLKIALENLKDSSTIVNHTSLLEEVEIELEIDNTLKNKIYKAIVVNYNKLSKPKKE